jgi:hypothetical protein
MCPSRRAVGRSYIRTQESRDASGRPALSAGTLTRLEKQTIAEMRACIARWQDAASTACNADPGVLIRAPCKVPASIRQRRFVTYGCCIPFAARLLRTTRTKTVPDLPIGRPCRPLPASTRATAFGRPTEWAGTHLVDEASGGEECVPREIASKETIHAG